MANQRTMSDEEVQLKRRARRRLIGAVTLVTVMVVTLPMVLDGEPKQSGQDIVINIPPQGSSGDFSPKSVPALEKKTPAPAQEPTEKPAQVLAPVVAPSPASPTVEAQPAVEAAKTDALKDSKLARAESYEPGGKTAQPTAVAVSQEKHKDEKPVAAPKQDGGPFVIQLGAFANMNNAKERQARLSALKIKFYTETVKAPGGDKLRVRAGPFVTRQEAERVQVKLKASGIQDGIVAEKKG